MWISPFSGCSEETKRMVDSETNMAETSGERLNWEGGDSLQ